MTRRPTMRIRCRCGATHPVAALARAGIEPGDFECWNTPPAALDDAVTEEAGAA